MICDAGTGKILDESSESISTDNSLRSENSPPVLLMLLPELMSLLRVRISVTSPPLSFLWRSLLIVILDFSYLWHLMRREEDDQKFCIFFFLVKDETANKVLTKVYDMFRFTECTSLCTKVLSRTSFSPSTPTLIRVLFPCSR